LKVPNSRGINGSSWFHDEAQWLDFGLSRHRKSIFVVFILPFPRGKPTRLSPRLLYFQVEIGPGDMQSSSKICHLHCYYSYFQAQGVASAVEIPLFLAKIAD
jgi:hypothetical protein